MKEMIEEFVCDLQFAIDRKYNQERSNSLKYKEIKPNELYEIYIESTKFYVNDNQETYNYTIRVSTEGSLKGCDSFVYLDELIEAEYDFEKVAEYAVDDL